MKRVISFLLMLCITLTAYSPIKSYAADISSEGYIFIGQSHTAQCSDRPEWYNPLTNYAGKLVRYTKHADIDNYYKWPNDSNIYFISSLFYGVSILKDQDGTSAHSSVTFEFLEDEAITACKNIMGSNNNVSHWNIIITQGTGPISVAIGMHGENGHVVPSPNRGAYDTYRTSGYITMGNRYVNLYNMYKDTFSEASVYYMEDALMYKPVYCNECYRKTYEYIEGELKKNSPDAFIPTWEIYEKYYSQEFNVDQAHYINTPAYYEVYSNAIKTIKVSEFAAEKPGNPLYRKCEDYKIPYGNYWNMSKDCGEFLAYYITFRKVNETALKIMNNHVEALEPAGLYNYLYMSAEGDSNYTYSISAVGLKEKEWITDKGNPYKSSSNVMRTYMQSINDLTGSGITWSTNLNGDAELKNNITSTDLNMIYQTLKSQKQQGKPYGGVLWLGNIGRVNYLGAENVSSWAAIIDVDLSSKKIQIVDPTQTVQRNLGKTSFNDTCSTWIDISSTSVNGMPIGITGWQIINGGDVSTTRCKTPGEIKELPKEEPKPEAPKQELEVTPPIQASYNFTKDRFEIDLPNLSGKEYKIAWVSDLHLCEDSQLGTDVTKDLNKLIERKNWFEQFMGLGAEGMLSATINELNHGGYDGVVFGGDIIDYCSQANIDLLNKYLPGLSIPAMYLRADHDYLLTYGSNNESEGKAKQGSVRLPFGDIQTLEFGDFVIVGRQDSTKPTTGSQLQAIKSLYNKGKPVIFASHVPYFTNGAGSPGTLKDFVLKYKGQEYYWGCSKYNIQGNDSVLVNDYLQNSNTYGILSGHVHGNGGWTGSYSNTAQEHIFSPAYAGYIGEVIIR